MTDDITVINETKRLEEYLRLCREVEQSSLTAAADSHKVRSLRKEVWNSSIPRNG